MSAKRQSTEPWSNLAGEQGTNHGRRRKVGCGAVRREAFVRVEDGGWPVGASSGEVGRTDFGRGVWHRAPGGEDRNQGRAGDGRRPVAGNDSGSTGGLSGIALRGDGREAAG